MTKAHLIQQKYVNYEIADFNQEILIGCANGAIILG